MLQHPAAERNKQHILGVIQKHVAEERSGAALEIASGPGSHVVLFAKHYKHFTWQPSDIDPNYLKRSVKMPCDTSI